jgi:alanine racemase
MPKTTETILEINLTALGNNYRYLKSKLNDDTKFLGVVKAFAYGSDAIVVAKELEVLGIDYFAVAYVNEGINLRNAGIKTPILVLHPQLENFETLIDRCLEPSLYSERALNHFIKIAAEKKQSNYPVHLKFNTGLNRLGFHEREVDKIFSVLNTTTSIKVASIFSHLAVSEDLKEKDFSETQINLFTSISRNLSTKINQQPKLHMCNTSGLLNFPEAQFDMVRCGIGLYGFSNIIKEQKNFTPVATLKTVISQIHHINGGESIGYNRSFKSTSPIITATLPIGHADGISRSYGNGKGWVWVHGKKASIIGNVCMDMIMVNVTGIDCKEGDEVIVFGAENSIENLTDNINSISYELLTAISQRVKRVITRK